MKRVPNFCTLDATPWVALESTTAASIDKEVRALGGRVRHVSLESIDTSVTTINRGFLIKCALLKSIDTSGFETVTTSG